MCIFLTFPMQSVSSLGRMQTPHLPASHMCLICKMEFDLRYDLRKHTAQEHDASKQASVSQPEEGERTNTKKQKPEKVKQNIGTTRKGEETEKAKKVSDRKSCEECPKTFAFSSGLSLHRQTHRSKNFENMKEEDESKTIGRTKKASRRMEEEDKARPSMMHEDETMMTKTKTKRRKKSVEDGVTNPTEAVEESLLAEDADMGEEEEDENMQELMGTNTHWDQGKQERSERKNEENAATNKELWGAEEDSGWYATSAKIISRLRSSFMQSQVLFTNRQYTLTFQQVPSERSQLSI